MTRLAGDFFRLDRFFAVVVVRFLAVLRFFAAGFLVVLRVVEREPDERELVVRLDGRFFVEDDREEVDVLRRRGAVVAKTARRYSTICGQRRTLSGPNQPPPTSRTNQPQSVKIDAGTQPTNHPE